MNKFINFIKRLFKNVNGKPVQQNVDVVVNNNVQDDSYITQLFDTQIEILNNNLEKNNNLQTNIEVLPNIIENIDIEPILDKQNPQNIFLEVFKKELPDRVIKELPLLIEKFGVNNNYRLAHLLGQCSHESSFKENIRENLNYSYEGLKKFVRWGRISDANAKKFGRGPNNKANQVEIANHIYGGDWGRRNLGNIEPSDGFKFRGAGYIQLTGRRNFKLLSDFVGIDFVKNPELVAKEYPLVAAGFFFMNRRIFPICDKGISVNVIKEISILINGGTLGLKHRESETIKFFNIMNNFETKNNIKLF